MGVGGVFDRIELGGICQQHAHRQAGSPARPAQHVGTSIIAVCAAHGGGGLLAVVEMLLRQDHAQRHLQRVVNRQVAQLAAGASLLDQRAQLVLIALERRR